MTTTLIVPKVVNVFNENNKQTDKQTNDKEDEMIESVTMSNVASFNGPTPVSIETNKKVTLLYGHNGSGKSTIGRYLQNPENIKFNACSFILKNANDYQILVYNTDFIEKNFSQSSFEGVFTLGENNVDAENKIKECDIKLEEIEKEINLIQNSIEKYESTIDLKTKSIQDKVFSVKRTFEKKRSRSLLR